MEERIVELERKIKRLEDEQYNNSAKFDGIGKFISGCVGMLAALTVQTNIFSNTSNTAKIIYVVGAACIFIYIFHKKVKLCP